jgi:hypothetical protein
MIPLFCNGKFKINIEILVPQFTLEFSLVKQIMVQIFSLKIRDLPSSTHGKACKSLLWMRLVLWNG